MRRGEWLDDGPDGLSLGTTGGPDALVHGVEQLEAKAILLRGTLNQFTRAQNNCADPMIALEEDKVEMDYSFYSFTKKIFYFTLKVCYNRLEQRSIWIMSPFIQGRPRLILHDYIIQT